MELNGKLAVVTGGTRGVGAGIARALVEAGAQVVVGARRAPEVPCEGAEFRSLDVRDPGSVRRFFDGLPRLDVLVNNAGTGRYAPVESLADESFREHLDVNVLGPFYFARAAVPQMKRQKSGQIVNIGSVVGLVGVARGTAYVATKWALRGMNECWREELYADGIKVAYVAPGYVITEFGGRKEDLGHPDAEWALTVDDVAHGVESIVDQGPNSDIRELVIQVRDRS